MINIDALKTAVQAAEEARLREQRERLTRNLTRFLTALVMLPVQAWVLMLVLGAVHSFAAPVAAVGYGTAILLALGVDLAADMARKFRRK